MTYRDFINDLDQNKIDPTISQRRYYTLIPYQKVAKAEGYIGQLRGATLPGIEDTTPATIRIEPPKTKKKDLFFQIRDAAETDKRFNTKSGKFFQNEAGDIKLKFKREAQTMFLNTVKYSYHLGITHVNDVELVVAYAMLRANPEWETKLEKEIGQPFYGTEKLIWRPEGEYSIRFVRWQGKSITAITEQTNTLERFIGG
jgi:hypothetical protein